MATLPPTNNELMELLNSNPWDSFPTAESLRQNAIVDRGLVWLTGRDPYTMEYVALATGYPPVR